MKEQRQADTEALLQQLSLRQEDIDRQVLQALQQAMSALVQAQQLIINDEKFHHKLRRSGYETLQDYRCLLPEKDGNIPPWLLAKPPQLQ
ncbi:MAG: hypothetical protein GX357_00155 [Firmicutes bacterium]|nr:hypothetical protein [Bacillota bacterium]